MHTSGRAACGRDDDGAGAPELCVRVSSPSPKIEEIFACVNRGLSKDLHKGEKVRANHDHAHFVVGFRLEAVAC